MAINNKASYKVLDWVLNTLSEVVGKIIATDSLFSVKYFTAVWDE